MASVLREKFRFLTTPCGPSTAWASHVSAPPPPSPLPTLPLRYPPMRRAHAYHKAFALAVSFTWMLFPSYPLAGTLVSSRILLDNHFLTVTSFL